MSFQAKLTSGEFVVLAEMDTPKGVDISDLVTNVRYLKSRVDAVVIPDLDNGVMHLGALAGGAVMRQQGMEPLIHVCGRDKNRMALQGDLLAAHVLGIHNLMVVKAEDMVNGDHPDAKIVNDLDELGILGMIQSLTSGTDLAGFELRGKPQFMPGIAVPPIADDAQLAQQVADARQKVAAGAGYIVLQPVFDMTFYTQIIDAFKPLNVPVIPAVFLLKNVGMARYISINDPCSRLSEDLIRRIRKAKDRDTECIAIAGEMIRKLADISQGIKISALGWEDRLPAILNSAGL
ncbi:MAG: methylenetetrahydrofolate reductase [Desulfotignum sp.]|nr:methylenetetrahydrofolate reductase [Desulfotignum sp.]MCF8112219.1 methylenetetrahydrofolate reductase [Desulfotignum sp.]MCF8125765.1 methylenetetrahydrofolate reductase [Desulfotignum sp.]